MAISMYTASIPVFRQYLRSLSAILGKAAQHAADRKIEPAALLQARLYPDMFPLVRQVQVACDLAKGAAARLAGETSPRFENDEQTFAELTARIERTIDYIESLPREAIEDSAGRAITDWPPRQPIAMTGQDYLLHHALGNFFFHATTAYGILRHNGVELGKRDFTGQP